MSQATTQLLTRLNTTYAKLHTRFEELFWLSYMGDHSVNKRKDAALKARDTFRSSPKLLQEVGAAIKVEKNTKLRERLKTWQNFFKLYQTPVEVVGIKDKITALERKINEKQTKRQEGYIDPLTKKFVTASVNKMSTMIGTHPDERVRKACFLAREKLAVDCLTEYLQLVRLLNLYARKLGFSDFYAYKLQLEEGMTKKELFSLFDKIYTKTKYAFADIRKLEQQTPGLRKPWNFGYLMAGDVVKEEDPYYQFENALMYWGRSYAALGINYQGGQLKLDLLDRQGKYSNGFCHYPKLVEYKNGKFLPGASNFTSNAVFGQVGSGARAINTLFHEGGHAADRLNTRVEDVILATEYPPASTAWAETQSMFIDAISSSIEWRVRYAKNQAGEAYPVSLYEKEVEKLHLLRPLGLMGIMFVANFERKVYESKNLTVPKLKAIGKEMYRKYFDRSEDSLYIFDVPHIYAWESLCSYHGYGLATLALSQWRDYFFNKYGYVVDNPEVGKEMTAVWRLGSTYNFKHMVKLATGKKLSADAYIDNRTLGKEKLLALAEKRIKDLARVKTFSGPVKLNAHIQMVHGKKVICDNKKSFEDMAEKYQLWLYKTQKKEK